MCIRDSIYISPNSNMLPDKNDPIIDLFAAETAGLLSFVYYLLKEKLDAVTPLFTKRILQELQERTVLPYLQRDDYWWMGLSGKKVNNWDPWCNSNVLWTAILTCHDQSPVSYTHLDVYKRQLSFPCCFFHSLLW